MLLVWCNCCRCIACKQLCAYVSISTARRRRCIVPSLASMLQIGLSKEVPVVVEYTIESVGFVRYYLAPKIDEDADEAQE